MRKLFFQFSFASFAIAVGGCLLFDRNFAHLEVLSGRTPLYAVDALLILSFIFLALSRGVRLPSMPGKLPLAILLATFIYSCTRGLVIYGIGDTVRDAVLLGYGVVIILSYSYATRSEELGARLLYGAGVILIFILLIRYICVWGDLMVPWSVPLQPACSALYYSGLLLAVMLCKEELSPKASLAIKILLGTLLVITSVRTSWLAWLVLIGLVFIADWRKTLRPYFQGIVYPVSLVSFVLAVLLSLIRPQYLFRPLMMDIRSVLVPIPSLAGPSFGNFRARYWMWGDAVREIENRKPKTRVPPPPPVASPHVGAKPVAGPPVPFGGVPSPKDIPSGVIANRELRIRAEKDPLVNGDASHLSAPAKDSVKLSKDPLLRGLFGYPMGKPFIPERNKNWMDEKRFDPHNSLISILYRMGTIGLISFLTWFLYLVFITYRRLKPGEASLSAKLQSWGFLFALYGFFHMQTDVTLESPFKAIFFWIAIGFCLLEDRPNKAQS